MPVKPPIHWTEKDEIHILDQRKLPRKEQYLVCRNMRQVVNAIRKLAIRGAPAIGIAISMGLALEARRLKSANVQDFIKRFEKLCREACKARPTAVNLVWAVERMRAVIIENPGADVAFLKDALKKMAEGIMIETVELDKAIAGHGETLVEDGMNVLTYCNTGTLATGGCGTALGIIRTAWRKGKRIHVYVCETRPLLQGSRLTAWELLNDNVPLTLITDNAAGYLMGTKNIDLVIVGADRIATNGDTANKVGTYSLAVLAKENGIPFYVAAPLSTFDPTIKKGSGIPIEIRDSKEVTHLNRKKVAPEGVNAYNPAFDITPSKYITGIVTENGIAKRPLSRSLRKLLVNT